MGRGREGLEEEGSRRKGQCAEGGENVGKGEGGLDFDICSVPPRVPSYATAATCGCGVGLGVCGLGLDLGFGDRGLGLGIDVEGRTAGTELTRSVPCTSAFVCIWRFPRALHC